MISGGNVYTMHDVSIFKRLYSPNFISHFLKVWTKKESEINNKKDTTEDMGETIKTCEVNMESENYNHNNLYTELSRGKLGKLFTCCK